MHKWSVRLLALTVVLGLTACGERLESGAACPALCSGESLALRDTVIDAVIIDTTLAGYPTRGSTNFHGLVNSGDTAEVRLIVRFDSLITTYMVGGDTVDITEVDSAYLRLGIEPLLSRFSAPVTFEAYDVDTTAVDSVTSALLPLFRPGRLLGSVTVDTAALKDSVRIFLNDDVVGAKVANGARLRVGVRITSAAPVRIAVSSANTGTFPVLRLDPAPADTAIDFITELPRSLTPVNQDRVAIDFTDYVVVSGGPPTLPSDVVAVGGPHGRRVYFRFSIPPRITDSTTIVRATLILTQKPGSTYGFADSLIVLPQVIIAGSEIIDLSKAALITDTVTNPLELPPSIFKLQPVQLTATAAMQREFHIGNVVRFWRSTSAERVPQAIILRSTLEGLAPQEALFYSTEAAANLRPRLVITYLLRREFGIP